MDPLRIEVHMLRCSPTEPADDCRIIPYIARWRPSPDVPLSPPLATVHHPDPPWRPFAEACPRWRLLPKEAVVR